MVKQCARTPRIRSVNNIMLLLLRTNIELGGNENLKGLGTFDQRVKRDYDIICAARLPDTHDR